MNPQHRQLLDRFLFEEIDLENPELKRAMESDAAFAKEVLAVQSTISAVRDTLGTRQAAHTDQLAEARITRGAAPNRAGAAEEVPAEEDIALTMGVLDAVESPTVALQSGGSSKKIVLRLVLPAAAILLAWALMHSPKPITNPVQNPADEHSTGNLGGAPQDHIVLNSEGFELIDFRGVVPPDATVSLLFYDSRPNEDDRLVLSIERILEDGILRLSKEERAKLLGAGAGAYPGEASSRHGSFDAFEFELRY